MLPKHQRLAAAEVREILKRGKTVRSAHLVAKYVPAAAGAAAVVVSKKTAKTAVARNRIRRSLYASLARTLPSRTHAVFMVQKNIPNYNEELETLCSALT